MPTGADLRPPGSYSTPDSFAALREQLSVTLVQMQSSSWVLSQYIAAEHNLVFAFQEQQNCLRLGTNYRSLISPVILVYIARHHPVNQPGEMCLTFNMRKLQM